MGPENGKDFQLIKNSMQRNKVPTVVLERHEFNQHIPNVNLTSRDAAIVETTAGVLYADRALKAAQVSHFKIFQFTAIMGTSFLKAIRCV